MNSSTPRLRMFAGPNGSGKSTIKAQVHSGLWGKFINADNIEKLLRDSSGLDFRDWGVEASADEIRLFFENSWVNAKLPGWATYVSDMSFEQSRVGVANLSVNSYIATVMADFLREKLLQEKTSFTFETVMSDSSKIRFMEKARTAGYRTYLYYVATRNPRINVSRVANRVRSGGHPVPENKIHERYFRSLDLLLSAIRVSDRAYIWDNSGQEALLFAEFETGVLKPQVSEVPAWFETFVLDKENSATQ